MNESFFSRKKIIREFMFFPESKKVILIEYPHFDGPELNVNVKSALFTNANTFFSRIIR
jgi:hypothetical protein